MSLIHWWPLNGDTKDYIGNKHGTLVNGGHVNGSGKIGKCYSSTNNASNVASSPDGISVPNCNLVGEVGNEYSFACWFLVHGTHGQYQSCIMSSGDWNQGNCWVIGFNNANTEICCPVDNFNTGKISIGYQLSNNVWYHLATVYKDGVTTAYLNGSVVGTVSRTGIYRSYSNHSYIGRDEGHGGFFPFNGDINDLRIYDHALSQAEVKELSKALVVHYSFNDVLAEPTTNLLPLSQQTQSNTAATIEVTSGLVNGGTYTLSTNITRQPDCTSTNPRLTLRFFYSDGTEDAIQKYNDGGTSYPKDGVERYYYVTATANSAKTLIKIGGWLMDHSSGAGKKMTATRSQLEAKDHATPYTPTSRVSQLYNETGLTQPSTSDNVSLTTNSKSGTLALNCQGNTQIICTNTGDTTKGVTASFWVKCSIPSDSRLVFADNNSKIAFGFFNNGQAIITCAGYVHACVSNIRTNWNSEWNHIIVRKTSNGVVECYINGVKQSLSGSQEWTHSNTNSLSVGCRYSGGWTSHFTGLIDDFRFYTTCLSDGEIKDLYETKGYISNKGDIMCGEFIEDKAEAMVTEKSTFECKEVYEEIDPAYERLEYIKSTGTQYIDTGISLGTNMVFDTSVSDVSEGAYIITQGNYGLRYLWSTFVNFVSGRRFRGTITGVAGVIYQVKGSNDFISINGINGNQESDNDNPSGNVMICSKGNCTMYKCALYNNNVLVRNFIPVKRKSDNVLGLYDSVNKVFYTNAGSGTFGAGPVVTNSNASIYEDGHISGREIIEI